MKKKLLALFIVSILSYLLCNCSGVSGSYTLTSYLEKSNNSPIILYSVNSIDKDEVPGNIYIIKDEQCLTYNNSGIGYDEEDNIGFNLSLTLGELAQLSDKEIISLYEGAWNDGYERSLALWRSHSKWNNRLSTGEATVYKNQYMPYEISVDTDSTGNSVESEWIYLPIAGYGESYTQYTMWYDGVAFDDYLSDGDFSFSYFSTGHGAERDLYTLCDPYEFVNAEAYGVVYDSTYVGYTDSDNGMLITRGNNLELELDGMTSKYYEIGRDYSEDDWYSLMGKFEYQYESCFEVATE